MNDKQSNSISHNLIFKYAGVFSVVFCSISVVASTFLMIYQCWIPAPFEDQWQQLVTGRYVSWSWLISQHNEHRILLPRFIFIADNWIAGERNIVDLTVNIAIQLALSIFFIQTFKKEVRLGFSRTVLFLSFVLCMTFWAVQWENFIWGFQVQFFGVTLGAAVTFYLVSFASRSITGLAAILLAMACTTFTLASGIVAAFLAIPLSFIVRRSFMDIAAIAIMAIVLLAAYLHGYQPIQRDPEGTALSARLGRDALHAVVDLGGPVGESLRSILGWDAVTSAGCAGLFGLCLFIALTWSAVSTHRSPAAMTLVAMAGFAVMAACLTASGRAVFGLDQALSSRYTSPILAFWIALSLLINLATSRGGSKRSQIAWVLPAVLIVLAVGSQRDFSATARQTMEARFAAIPALAARVMDIERLRPIQNDPKETFGYLDRLEGAKTSFYAEDWLRWKGEQLTEHVSIADPSLCRGDVSVSEAVGQTPNAGWRVSGKVRRQSGQMPRRLILADDTDKVTGFGVVTPLNQNAAGDGFSTWSGYVAGVHPSTIVPYLFVSDATVCSLGPSDISYAVEAILSPLPSAHLTPGG